MSDIKKKTRKPRAKKAVAHVVPVIRVINPFDPREHVREELVWKSNKTLTDYFPLTPTELVISVNGKIVAKDQYGVTYLDRGDNVVVCPVPAGGDDGKGVLGMVAMIAVAVFAQWAAPLLLPAGTGTLGVGIMTAGITMAGSLLVNALLAPPQKTSKSASQAYGIDGAKNTSLEGVPVPICYGRFRTAGNIVGLYTENDGDTQNLYMLINAGEGPVVSITDIEINDNPIDQYKDHKHFQESLHLPQSCRRVRR